MAVDTRPKRQRKEKNEEKRMELTEHLGELRARIIRIFLWLVIGTIVSYIYFKPIYALLFRPMQVALRAHPDWKIIFTQFTQPFFVVLQISAIAGLIMVFPLITMELWGFVGPALTKEEKRPLRYIAPFSVCLFAAGVLLAYWVAQFAIGWFIGFVDLFPNAVLYQDPKAYVIFMLKLMGAFGVTFQLPVVLMFFAWVGLLRSQTMKRSWRTAVVGIAILGLLVTPSNDVFTMLMMIVPVTILYLGSIFLVQIVERKRYERLRRQSEAGS